MKRTLSALGIAAFLAAMPMYASVYSVDFTGVVDQTQGATGDPLGSSVTGHFDLDSSSGTFLDFTIAGKSVAAGYSSSAVLSPPFADAVYTAQISPVSSGGSTNSTFSLDLSSLSFWPETDNVYTLLTDTTQLSTNLDTINDPASAFPSNFGYYTATASGTNVVSLNADLTSLSVTTSGTATPEPANLALLGGALLSAGFFLRRRKA